MAVITQTPRIAWVDVAKAFSILLVVLVHTVVELNYLDISNPVVDDAMPILGTMRMPLFFAASGLFAAGWVSRKPWRTLIDKKIALLVWVFLIWQPVVLAYKLAEMRWLPNQPDNTVVGQVAKFVVSPLRPNGELWFLWALAVFFVLTKLTWRLPTWLKVGVPAVVSAVWLAYSDDLIPESVLRAGGDGLNGLCAYYFFFISAVLYADKIKDFFSTVRWPAATGIVALWVVVEIALQFTDFTVPGLSLLVRVLAVAAGFALATMVMWSRPLAWLGANTLQVYVGHMVFVVIAALTINATGIELSGWAGLVIPVVFAWAVLGAIALHRAAARVPLGRFLYEQPGWFALRPADADHPKRRRVKEKAPDVET
ncbi:acyltransferase [Gordonia sp. IITR100]|uniref:acyltransferase family protein n=1 Tax=Gordonia sp. IITR100 TaxID=1314686 RepID=UPI00159604D1|nr:acyltransferase [Gordonia sp. IITR100]